MSSRKIENLIPEQILLDVYGLTSEMLRTWRNSGLDFVQLGRGCRGYWEDSLVGWLEATRTRNSKDSPNGDANAEAEEGKDNEKEECNDSSDGDT